MSFLLESPARGDTGYLLGALPPAHGGLSSTECASTHGFYAVGHMMSALTGLAQQEHVTELINRILSVLVPSCRKSVPFGRKKMR